MGYTFKFPFLAQRVELKTKFLRLFEKSLNSIRPEWNLSMPSKKKMADHFCYPPRAMRAERAAAYLSMATSTFLKLVDEGVLPGSKRVSDKLVFWDRNALDAWVEFFDDGFVGNVKTRPVNPLEAILGGSYSSTRKPARPR
jgi:predicted DNA-binding transcriptional regulator AlpA